MNSLLNDVVTGIFVAASSGIAGYLIRKRFFQEAPILPRIGEESYQHLDGKWNLYYVTRDKTVDPDPIWMHGIEEIEIEKYQVKGTTELTDHRNKGLRYVVRGQVISGRMVLTDVCIQDETEFAFLILPNLRSRDILIGIWCGVDNQLRPIAAPALLSRAEMDTDELNKVVENSGISLLPIESQYHLFSDVFKG